MQTVQNMSFIEAIAQGFRKSFDFKGRARRTEYWYWTLFAIIANAGAAILDVNMGLSGINEAAMMKAAICRIMKSTPAILCIDSTNAETVEAALRLYPGRALLNSISAEEGKSNLCSYF